MTTKPSKYPLVNRILIRISIALFFNVVWVTSLLLVVLLAPYRSLVRLLAWIHRPQLTDFITGGVNSYFASSDSDGLHSANICIFVILEGKLDVVKTRREFLHRIIEAKDCNGRRIYSRLRQHITTFMGYNFLRWDHNWDLRKHVRMYDYDGGLALPKPFKESDLEQVVGQFAALPWKTGQSPWECLICEGFESNAKTLLAIRISHGLADGYCVQDLLLRLSDGAVIKSVSQPRPHTGVLLSLASTVVMPLRLFWDLGCNYAAAMAADSEWKLNPRAPRTFCASIMPAVTVDIVKNVKGKYGISYSAVLMAALSRGLYRVIKLAGQCPPEGLECVMPILKPDHPKGLTNHLYTTRMKLPLLEKLTAENLRELSQRYEKSIKTLAPKAVDYTGLFVSLLPRFFTSLFLKIENGSVAIGNFPVLMDELSIQGHRTEGVITSMALLSRNMKFGATVSMGGADGKQRVTVNMNTNVYKNPQVFRMLGEFMQQEILMLAEN